jgi:hypothetical protein
VVIHNPAVQDESTIAAASFRCRNRSVKKETDHRELSELQEGAGRLAMTADTQ